MNIKQLNYDIVIIGGGPAGLYAAYNASLNGAKSILVIERDRELGGILQQCIHNGFGLQLFKQELTGPSYAQRCYDLVKDIDKIEFLVDTMVVDIQPDKTVIACGADSGFIYIKAKAIILAMGCRERTRGAIKIAGSRPAGVFTAGSAQRMVNMEGVLPGNTAVILGSGDIGLIMARRLSLEGVKVLACIEISPYSNGLTRNIVQCLDDYNIPLYLSHTISQIHGNDRVEGVTVVKVDKQFNPIAGTEFELKCDTVLLSVGLIPENELAKKINVPLHPLTNGAIVDQNRLSQVDGIFAAGNVLHVHDLADFASLEAAIAGKSAALYVQETLLKAQKTISVVAGEGVRTVVPQILSINQNSHQDIDLFVRPSQPKDNVKLEISSGNKIIATKNIIAARPSEMLIAKIKASDIEKIQNTLDIKLTGR